MVEDFLETGPRYSAFLSYSHADQIFARWLHRKLESYRLPKYLSSRARAGTATRRLRPVFRDRDELAASADLTAAVREAIGGSAYLIVVCSQDAAKSVWVGREIALFRSLHGADRILAALVPGGNESCFPAELSCAAEGAQPHMPLAADFGRHADGARLALLKLVAVLAGVGLDQLVQRDTQRRMRLVASASAAAVAGMAILALISVAALRARDEADRAHARDDKLIDYQQNALRARLKAAGRLDLLEALNQGAVDYYGTQELSRLSSGDLTRRAKLLQAQGEVDDKQGRFPQARAAFEEALRTTTALLAQQPEDEGRIFAQSQSQYWVGFIDWRTGDQAGAARAFNAYLDLAGALLRISPGKPEWLRERAYANTNLGMLALRHKGDTVAAGRYLSQALEDRLRAAKTQPDDATLQDDIGDSYAWLGDNSRAALRLEDALQWRAKERVVRNALLRPDPRDAQVRTELVANLLAISRIKSAQGHYDDAVRLLDQAHEDALRLSRDDPKDLDGYQELRVLDLFKARNWMMMPQAERPSVAAILSLIGDCQSDRAGPNGDELAVFCTVLAARGAALTGDAGAARQRLQPVLAAANGADRYSRHWQLDFADEVAQVTKYRGMGDNRR